jgi:hypothetical protein
VEGGISCDDICTYQWNTLLYSGLVGSASSVSRFVNAGANVWAGVGQKQLVSVENMQICCMSDEHLKGEAVQAARIFR